MKLSRPFGQVPGQRVALSCLGILALLLVQARLWHQPGVLGVLLVAVPACSGLALIGLVTWRARLSEVLRWPALFGWSVLFAVVGILAAISIELLVREHVGLVVFRLIAGPVEEAAKILIPASFYAFARWRNPRAGSALVLATAVLFAVLEAYAYSGFPRVYPGLDSTPAHPTDFGDVALRGSVELLHPLLSGFAAAVIWRQAHLRGHFLTWTGLGAFALAAALHGGFDAATIWLPYAAQAALLAGVIVVGYLMLFRPAWRALVPPNAIESNPRAWVPRLGRSLRGSTSARST